MASILQTITQLISGVSGTDGASGAVSWVGSWLSVIGENQTLILFCIALPLVGLGVGLIKRLVRIRA